MIGKKKKKNNSLIYTCIICSTPRNIKTFYLSDKKTKKSGRTPVHPNTVTETLNPYRLENYNILNNIKNTPSLITPVVGENYGLLNDTAATNDSRTNNDKFIQCCIIL